MPGTLTGQILVFTTLAVFVSTALLGVLHLWKVRTIPAPYDKWVLGTVIAGMVTAALHTAVALINPPPAPPPATADAAPCTLRLAAADAAATLSKMTAGDCAATLQAALQKAGYFRQDDAQLADRLAGLLPKRRDDESELQWRTRVSDAIEDNPLLKTLNQRAHDHSAPFIAMLFPARVTVPAGSRPPAGTVYVSDPGLDKHYLRLYSVARGCSLVLRAEYRIRGMADADPPLIQINVRQMHYLFGSLPGKDGIDTSFAPAPGDSSTDLGKEGDSCYTAN